MKPRSLFKKLLLSHTVVILVTLVVLGGFFSYLLQGYFSQTREQQLQNVAKSLSNNSSVRQSILRPDLENLDNLIKQLGQLTDADIVIVDASGKSLASTASGVVGTVIDKQEIRDVLGGNLVSHWGGTFLGTPSLTVGHPVKFKNKVVGGVFLDSSVKGFQANLFRFRLFIVYAALVALGLGAILAYILAKGISKPIQQMSKAAKAVALGEKIPAIVYSSNDEIGDLTNLFNHSITEIQNTWEKQRQLEELRREFVANVSHEFRAPVTSLQGFLELLQDGVIPVPEQKKYYDLMLKDIGRLNRLVSELLDLARFQAGQASIKPVSLDPGQLGDEVLAKLRPRAREKGVQLISKFTTPQPEIMADGDRLEQILLNLLDNALRFTPRGGNVTLSINPTDDTTIFQISDSGIGIPQEDLPFVFERFYMVDKARTPDKGGTGLGLAIVKELVEAHRGQIEVTSVQGQGTTFTVTLPNLQD